MYKIILKRLPVKREPSLYTIISLSLQPGLYPHYLSRMVCQGFGDSVVLFSPWFLCSICFSKDHSYCLPLPSPVVLAIPSSFPASLTDLTCLHPHMTLKIFSLRFHLPIFNLCKSWLSLSNNSPFIHPLSIMIMLIKYPESITLFLCAFLTQTTNICHWEL